MGWATLSGNLANAAAYKRNAPQYKLKPSQNGQLPKANHGSEREGNFRGGTIAILIKRLAAALVAMPSINISHFTR